MTLEDLIKLYRAQSGDGHEPYFCDDELLRLYANEAQEEACRRSPLLLDSTSAMTTVEAQAEAVAVALDEKIVHIRRAFVGNQPLAVLNVEDMDQTYPGWEVDPLQDAPKVLVQGVNTGAVSLWPRPKVACTLRLTVQRLPLTPMTELVDTPEIRPEYRRGLVDWMLFRAYSRQDNELYNDTKALLAERRFEAEFGRKASARNETWQRQQLQTQGVSIA